ncbi:MAG: CidA/LrgA family protein [Gammaproteobacteria bacterium]|jgi:holin-like protein
MIVAFTLLLVFQTFSEIVVQLADLPVPGPVIGMLLLFLTLCVRGTVPAWLRESCQQLLSHLSLLFVPAGLA